MGTACEGCGGNGSAFVPCQTCGAGIGERAGAETETVADEVTVVIDELGEPEPEAEPAEDEPEEPEDDQNDDPEPAEGEVGYASILPE